MLCNKGLHENEMRRLPTRKSECVGCRRARDRDRGRRPRKRDSGKVCSEEGCDKPLEGRGLCSTHYARLKRQMRVDRPKPPPPVQIDLPPFTGLCAGDPNPSLWDNHVDGEGSTQRDIRHEQARRICYRCDTRYACAVFAYLTKADGVWGGVVFGHAREAA